MLPSIPQTVFDSSLHVGHGLRPMSPVRNILFVSKLPTAVSASPRTAHCLHAYGINLRSPPVPLLDFDDFYPGVKMFTPFYPACEKFTPPNSTFDKSTKHQALLHKSAAFFLPNTASSLFIFSKTSTYILQASSHFLCASNKSSFFGSGPVTVVPCCV